MNFFKKRSLKKRIRNTAGDARADAIYEYLRLSFQEATKGQDVLVSEYELVSARFLGNVVAAHPNRKATTVAFQRITRLARALINEPKKRKDQ